jgi:hypothetical protein
MVGDDDRPEVSLLFAVAALVLADRSAIFVKIQNSLGTSLAVKCTFW